MIDSRRGVIPVRTREWHWQKAKWNYPKKRITRLAGRRMNEEAKCRQLHWLIRHTESVLSRERERARRVLFQATSTKIKKKKKKRKNLRAPSFSFFAESGCFVFYLFALIVLSTLLWREREKDQRFILRILLNYMIQPLSLCFDWAPTDQHRDAGRLFPLLPKPGRTLNVHSTQIRRRTAKEASERQAENGREGR